ncbi:hypothetical protein RDABS01_003635 [Bienertia sinuspersici]
MNKSDDDLGDNSSDLDDHHEGIGGNATAKRKLECDPEEDRSDSTNSSNQGRRPSYKIRRAMEEKVQRGESHLLGFLSPSSSENSSKDLIQAPQNSPSSTDCFTSVASEFPLEELEQAWVAMALIDDLNKTPIEAEKVSPTTEVDEQNSKKGKKRSAGGKWGTQVSIAKKQKDWYPTGFLAANIKSNKAKEGPKMWELLWLEEDEIEGRVLAAAATSRKMVTAPKGPQGSDIKILARNFKGACLTGSPTIPFICHLANNLITDILFL